ncbi:hypothetical protein [Bartonella birtlesii]|uniref:Uncharacterized protein n=1 Tax=Bartonella birtlesii LL-WM9 TaxID=1094552 RepID=J0PV48_9HYPH|nr:hypothetical protein [Bartonella birtlesii]EJF76461.1 hypothetical protein ME7_01005 [Bartonella birtlesii LL-WM9]
MIVENALSNPITLHNRLDSEFYKLRMKMKSFVLLYVTSFLCRVNFDVVVLLAQLS